MKKILFLFSVFGFITGIFLSSFGISILAQESDGEIPSDGFFSNFYFDFTSGVKSEGIKQDVAVQVSNNLNAMDSRRNYDGEAIQEFIENGTLEGKIRDYVDLISGEQGSNQSVSKQEISLIEGEYGFEKRLWTLMQKLLSKSITREMINGGNVNPCPEEGICFDMMDDFYKLDIEYLFGDKEDEDDNPEKCDHINECRDTCQGQSLCREPCGDDFHECIEKKLLSFIEEKNEITDEDYQFFPYLISEGLVFKNYSEIVGDLIPEDDSDSDAETDLEEDNSPPETENISHQDKGSLPSESENSFYAQIRNALDLANEISLRNPITKKSQYIVGGLHLCQDAVNYLAENGPAINAYFVSAPSIYTTELIKNQRTEKIPLDILRLDKIIYESISGSLYADDQFFAEDEKRVLDSVVQESGITSLGSTREVSFSREEYQEKLQKTLEAFKKEEEILNAIDWQKDYLDLMQIFDGYIKSIREFSVRLNEQEGKMIDEKKMCK